MNEFIGELSLDLDCRKTMPKISAGQFDKGRKYLIHITANGSAFPVSGSTVIIQGIHQDKSRFSTPCSLDNEGNVILLLTEDILSVSGFTYAKLVLSDSSKNYSTQVFIIDVEGSYEGDITATDNYSIVNDFMNRLMTLFELESPSDMLDTYPCIKEITEADLDVAVDRNTIYDVYSEIGNKRYYRYRIMCISDSDTRIQYRFSASAITAQRNIDTRVQARNVVDDIWLAWSDWRSLTADKVDKSRKIAGIDLQDDIESSDLADALWDDLGIDDFAKLQQESIPNFTDLKQVPKGQYYYSSERGTIGVKLSEATDVSSPTAAQYIEAYDTEQVDDMLVNKESTSNKVTVITSDNKDSTSLYLSVNAVVEYLDSNYKRIFESDERPPSQNSSSLYAIGDIWINNTSNTVHVLTSAKGNYLYWSQLGARVICSSDDPPAYQNRVLVNDVVPYNEGDIWIKRSISGSSSVTPFYSLQNLYICIGSKQQTTSPYNRYNITWVEMMSADRCYTKSEVNNLISAISTLSFEVVQTKPTQNIKTNVIYLIPNGDSGDNIYDEWIYVNNAWERIGSTAIDLSGKENISNKSNDFSFDLTPTAKEANMYPTVARLKEFLSGNYYDANKIDDDISSISMMIGETSELVPVFINMILDGTWLIQPRIGFADFSGITIANLVRELFGENRQKKDIRINVFDPSTASCFLVQIDKVTYHTDVPDPEEGSIEDFLDVYGHYFDPVEGVIKKYGATLAMNDTFKLEYMGYYELTLEI